MENLNAPNTSFSPSAIHLRFSVSCSLRSCSQGCHEIHLPCSDIGALFYLSVMNPGINSFLLLQLYISSITQHKEPSTFLIRVHLATFTHKLVPFNHLAESCRWPLFKIPTQRGQNPEGRWQIISQHISYAFDHLPSPQCQLDTICHSEFQTGSALPETWGDSNSYWSNR